MSKDVEKNMEAKSGVEQFGYEQSLKRVLGIGPLIFYGFAYMVPLTIFTTYGIVMQSTHGMLALAYVVATVGMLLTALSYGKMVKAYPIAGSVYSYAQRAIHPNVGFLSGWAIMMDYLLLPMINYLVASVFLHPVFPSIPTWIWILGYIILVTIINIIGIRITTWANNVLVLIQLVFLLALVIFIAKWLISGGGAGTFFDWKALFNQPEFHAGGGWPMIFGGASILALSFLGFDAITTLSEETVNPKKNIPRAIVIVCLGGGVGFILISYLLELAWPTGWAQFKTADTGAYEIIGKVAGSFMGYFFTAAYCIGCLASAMASSASASRILFGMGRDGVLPKFFAGVNKKFQTPINSIIVLAIVSLTALFLSVDTAVSFINFGALAGFTLVNVSVIFHYYIHGKQRDLVGTLKYLVLPLLGGCVTFAIWISLSGAAKILGFAWIGVGVVYLLVWLFVLKRKPPELKMDE